MPALPGAGAPPRRILVTGATAGLGLVTARALLDAGEAVVLHARTPQRAAALAALAPRAAGMVFGDLGSARQTRALVEQLARIGPVDVVIHNAGVYGGAVREASPEAYPLTLAVNVLAPYLLTALMPRPGRLIYLSSAMHRSAEASLQDVTWTARRWNRDLAYAESKLLVTALALAVARYWPGVASHAVDPGWVPTRMGGADAPDDLTLGYLTQVWLATSDDSATTGSGAYWHHRQRLAPHPAALDPAFQDCLLARLAGLTGVGLD